MFSSAGDILGSENHFNDVMSVVINFYCIINNHNEKFLELRVVKYTLYTFDAKNTSIILLMNFINARVFENDKTLININNIISII